MQNLKNFIDDNNRWIAFFNTAPMTFPLSQVQVNDLARTLDSKLSPENLHCDGEISRAEAGRKYRFLSAVAQELTAYCNSNGLNAPTIYEL
jgi:hypothetical protein